jgi:hypothetical protein
MSLGWGSYALAKGDNGQVNTIKTIWVVIATREPEPGLEVGYSVLKSDSREGLYEGQCWNWTKGRRKSTSNTAKIPRQEQARLWGLSKAEPAAPDRGPGTKLWERRSHRGGGDRVGSCRAWSARLWNLDFIRSAMGRQEGFELGSDMIYALKNYFSCCAENELQKGMNPSRRPAGTHCSCPGNRWPGLGW